MFFFHPRSVSFCGAVLESGFGGSAFGGYYRMLVPHPSPKALHICCIPTDVPEPFVIFTRAQLFTVISLILSVYWQSLINLHSYLCCFETKPFPSVSVCSCIPVLTFHNLLSVRPWGHWKTSWAAENERYDSRTSALLVNLVIFGWLFKMGFVGYQKNKSPWLFYVSINHRLGLLVISVWCLQCFVLLLWV